MYSQKQLRKELYKLSLLEKIHLVVYHKNGFQVDLSLCVFDALKLSHILPNKPIFYDYEKDS